MTSEEVKAAADRAEARAQGKTAAEKLVVTALNEGELNVEIAKLAALPVGVYESERVAAAKRLAMRAAILDKLVQVARAKHEGDEQGTVIELISRAPSDEKVDGSALLAGIIKQIGTPIFLPDNERLEIALWVVASYAFDAFFIFPRLRLKSATKGCGKSTLLDVLECLVNKPLIPSNVTGPSLCRIIAKCRPTMLLDEADRYMKADECLTSIVDAGHKKNGTVLRCVGDNQEVRAFSVWAPMAIAAIRSLPATIEDRAIMIDMQRKPPGLKLKRFRSDRPNKELAVLASQAARWGADNQVALGNADPEVPDALSNRAGDNWRPLLAVAELIGGEWVQKARDAAKAVRPNVEDDELGVRMLADIKEVFVGDSLHSRDLVAALIAQEAAPWGEVTYGRPLTAARMGTFLRAFGIQPEQIKIGGINRNGYRRDQFTKAFAAYLDVPNAAQAPDTPLQGSTASTAMKDNEKNAFQGSTSDFPGRGLKSEIPEEKQNGRGGRPLEPPVGRVGANGHGAAPVSDIEAAYEELRDRRELPQDDLDDIPLILDRRPPKPGECARVRIKVIRPPALGPPGDNLDDSAKIANGQRSGMVFGQSSDAGDDLGFTSANQYIDGLMKEDR
jgi:putative DNA primase/helicase